MIVKLQNVRIAFANIFEAKAVQGDGDPRYSAVFLLAPDDANCKSIEKALASVATEKWKDKGIAVAKKLFEDGRVCYLRSAKTDKNGEVYEGFEDTYSITASNKARPLVIDRDKSPLTIADGRPYSGSYVNATIEIWAQDNNWGRRLNATLKGVQFVADGDAFGGGRVSTPDDFDDLSVDGEAPSSDSEKSLF